MSFLRNKKRLKKGFITGLILGLIILILSNQAAEGQISQASEKYLLTPARQYQLFQKILTFERTWKKKSPTEVNLAILYEKNYELSSWIKEEFVAAVKTEAQIEGLPVRWQEIAIEEADNLFQLLSQEKILFLYITPLRPVTQKNHLKKIIDLCSKLKVATFTGETSYVDFGVAIGLGVADQSPQVIINLQAARKQGLDLSSQLLRMSAIK